MTRKPESVIDRLLASPARPDLLERLVPEARSQRDVFEQIYPQLLECLRSEPARVLAAALHVQRALGSAATNGQSARLLRLQAHALRWLGRAREAAARYRGAYEEFRRARDTAEMGRTAIGWTASLALCGEPQQAQRVAQLGKRYLPARDRLALARMDSNLANAWLLAGRVGRADVLYRSAMRRLERGGDPAGASGAAYNLGLIELKRARPRQARRRFEQARAVMTAAGSSVPAAYARAGLASVDLVEGKWDAGIAAVRELREFFREVQDERAVAQMHRDLGTLFVSVGAAQAAEPETGAALDAYGRLGLEHDAAHTALLHARLLLQGGWHQDAYTQLLNARRHWTRAGHAGHRARVELELAGLLLQQGRLRRAAALLAGSQPVLDRGDRHGDAARCRALRAQVHLAQRHPVAARRLALTAYRTARRYPARLERPHIALLVAKAAAGCADAAGTLRWAGRAVAELELLLLRFGSRQLRLLVGGARSTIYRDAVELVLAHGGPRAALLAVDLLSKAKSPALIEDLLHGDHGAFRPEVRAAITQLRDELLRATPGEGDTRFRSLQGHATRLESALGPGPRRRPALVRAAWSRRGVRHWRPQLRDRQLVMFHHGQDGWRAFVIAARGAARIVELPDVEQALRTGWRPLRMTLEAAARAPLQRRAEFLDRTLAASERELGILRAALWQPLELAAEQVIIVPDGALHAVPLEALATDGPGRAATIVSRLPHPALLHSRSRRRRGQALLLHGAGEQVQAEVASVSGVLEQAGLSVTVDCRREALATTRRPVDVLHVSAHGAFHRDWWLLSGISLADGWLGFERLRRGQLRGALLYFSSCESGLTQESPGSDLQGWMTSGLGAGARELLLTLWKVDDDSSVAFARQFYPHWTTRGAAVAAAAARAAVRAQLPHPYHWAPFVAVGATQS